MTTEDSQGAASKKVPSAARRSRHVRPTFGNRPKLYSNVINGHKVVRFASGSLQRLTVAVADSPISAAGSFTLVTVFKTTTAGAASTSFYNNTGLLGAEQSGVVPDWALPINMSTALAVR